MSPNEEMVDAIRCPICGGAAERGTLYGESRCFKWLPGNKSLFLGQWAIGGLTVGRSGFRFASGRSQAYGIRCLCCKRLIIDSDQIGIERIQFTVQILLTITAIIAGACAGVAIISRMIDGVASIFFGFALGGVIGWLIGISLLRLLEHFVQLPTEDVRTDKPHLK